MEGNNKNKEKTFIMIKPDAVHRGLVGEIIKRFENRGYKLLALKFVTATQELLQEHYKDLAKKPFFPSLISYMMSGPVVPMVWEGKNAVLTGRDILGKTNPLDSAPGSIRGDLSIDIGRNVCHGSDSVETAEREISIWFKPEEVQDWKPALAEWIYE